MKAPSKIWPLTVDFLGFLSLFQVKVASPKFLKYCRENCSRKPAKMFWNPVYKFRKTRKLGL